MCTVWKVMLLAPVYYYHIIILADDFSAAASAADEAEMTQVMTWFPAGFHTWVFWLDPVSKGYRV